MVEPPPVEIEPTVRGESKYDQVTSFLMAVVLGAILVVGWLALFTRPTRLMRPA